MVTAQLLSDPPPSALVHCRSAAKYLLQRLDRSTFKGVCFFDPSQRTWAVLDPSGRCGPLSSAAIAERDAFVLYDDARCRGADLKLRREAVGLLTLGPGEQWGGEQAVGTDLGLAEYKGLGWKRLAAAQVA